MFLDYNKVKKFLIDNVTSVKTVDEYINDLNTLNFMDIILENISFEVVVLLNTITYEVYFNSKSVGFVEIDKNKTKEVFEDIPLIISVNDEEKLYESFIELVKKFIYKSFGWWNFF